MFGDYTLAELGSILVMQGFSGLILFSVFLLMALGLAIIFGQMGVINMAHGEFMILGAYMTYLCSHLFERFFPSLYGGYFFAAMAVAFVVAGALGLLVEWLLIRHLYARPLDTLLATWGLSLIMQQAFRSTFGAREVGVELPQWMMGSLPVTDTIEVQINGLFVMGLTMLITAVVALLLYRSRWGLQVRAVVSNRTMSGRHRHAPDRHADIRARLRHRRDRRQRLHHDRLDRPDRRPALHRRYVPGGGVRRRAESARHHRVGVLDLAVTVDPRVLPHGLDGQGAHPAHRHRPAHDAAAGVVRPQGKEVTISCRPCAPTIPAGWS
jgi:hypothetical protein